MTVAASHGINPRAPLKTLPVDKRKLLLFGTGEELYHVKGTNRFGEQTSITETFEGFVPLLLRRHKETESEFMKEEINKFMSLRPCESCHRNRLKPEALAVNLINFVEL